MTVFKFKKDNMKVPCFIWHNMRTFDKQALQQIITASKLPFIFHHTCVMADGHKGYSLPIGGVVACLGVVSPAMVGFDQGCGMLAVKTGIKITELNRELLIRIKKLIETHVPVGLGTYNQTPQEWEGFNNTPDDVVIQKQLQSARFQLGSLGSNNHFLEIQSGSDGYIWYMIHSGSRNLGHKVATHYNKLALNLNKKWHSDIKRLKGDEPMSFLPVDTQEGVDFITALDFTLKFAQASRENMSNKIQGCITQVLKCTFEKPINIHHNYAALENHYGKNVWVHRKGATSAKKGQLGIIPGSQGTKSFIVRGKGSQESFTSCSHGAGRILGRKKAKQTLKLNEELKLLEDKGILHSIKSKANLDESPSAYKDIDIVMKAQKDLVDIVVELSPLAVVKG